MRGACACGVLVFTCVQKHSWVHCWGGRNVRGRFLWQKPLAKHSRGALGDPSARGFEVFLIVSQFPVKKTSTFAKLRVFWVALDLVRYAAECEMAQAPGKTLNPPGAPGSILNRHGLQNTSTPKEFRHESALVSTHRTGDPCFDGETQGKNGCTAAGHRTWDF